MTGRLRRTRIYGANYSIGESYYKPTLDGLDRKQLGNSNQDFNPIGILKLDRGNDDTPLHPNLGFQRELSEPNPILFDYCGREPAISSVSGINDEFDEDVLNSIKKIRDRKRASPCFIDEPIAPRERTRKNVTEKSYLDNMKTLNDFDDSSLGLSTLTADIFQSGTSAFSRATATKERLANIESEMTERFDKQVQREKRSQNLKQMLSANGIETSKVVKKVTF